LKRRVQADGIASELRKRAANQPSYTKTQSIRAPRNRARDIGFVPSLRVARFNPAENVGSQKFGARPRDDYPKSLRAARLILSRRR